MENADEWSKSCEGESSIKKARADMSSSELNVDTHVHMFIMS